MNALKQANPERRSREIFGVEMWGLKQALLGVSGICELRRRSCTEAWPAFAVFCQHAAVPEALVKKHHFDASEAYEGMSKEKIRGNLAQSISNLPATEEVVCSVAAPSCWRADIGTNHPYVAEASTSRTALFSAGFLYLNLHMGPHTPFRHRWLLHHGCWRSSVRL